LLQSDPYKIIMYDAHSGHARIKERSCQIKKKRSRLF